MKRLIGVAMLLVAGLASGADLTVTVPAAAVPEASLRCEELRVEMRVRAADWSNDICASTFTRLGLQAFVAKRERRNQVAQVDQAVRSAIEQFELDWPVPVTPASCGDGTTDAEFGEQCDDGNDVPFDGCSPDCVLAVCGDSNLDVGEQCDDGNTDPGDGCDELCQNE